MDINQHVNYSLLLVEDLLIGIGFLKRLVFRSILFSQKIAYWSDMNDFTSF